MEFNGYELIYLEPDVQLNRVVERIRESSSSSMAFVIHDRSPLLYSGVNLDLIRRRLEEEEKEGVFITSHPQLVKILQRDGWRIYSSLEELEGGFIPSEVVELIREDKREGITPRSPRKRRFLFLLLLLVIGFSIFFYLQATAVVIEIIPTRSVFTQELTFTGDLQGSHLSLEEGLLPLKEFSISQRLEKDFPATGRQVVGMASAQGRVHFINQSSETVFVPEGTLLKSTGGVAFMTLEEARVPAATQEFILDVVVGTKAGGAEVAVEAKEKGSTGNVAAGKIREWVMGAEDVLVINPQRTSGGADQEIPVITEEDLTRGWDWMEEELSRLAAQELKGNLLLEHLVVRDLNSQSQIEIHSSKGAGEEGAFFYLTGSIQGDILYLEKEELEYLVTNSFMKGLSPGVRVGDQPLEIQDLYMSGSREDGYHIHLTISGEVVAVIDTQDLRDAFTGSSMDAAHRMLATMEAVDCFRITGADRERLPPFSLGLKVIVEE